MVRSHFTNAMDMTHLEELGFLKIDFLIEKTIIDDTVKLIQTRDPKFKLEEIGLGAKTYELLQKRY